MATFVLHALKGLFAAATANPAARRLLMAEIRHWIALYLRAAAQGEGA